MECFTTEQRIFVIQSYYENGRSVKVTFRKIREFFGQHNRPSESGIRAMVKRFEKTGSVSGQAPYQHARPARTRQNITTVIESVQNQPGTSIRRRSQQLGLTYGTLRRILKVDLPNAHKIQTVAAAEVQTNGIKTSSSRKHAAPKALPAAEATKENYVDKIKAEVVPPAAKKSSKSKAAKKEETPEQEDSEVEFVE